MLNRSSVPKHKNAVPFEIPQIEVLTLQNGIKVYFVKKENLPIISLSLQSISGSKFESNEKKGLSYLTSLLIDEGAGEFNSLQLNDEFERLGTIFSVSVNQDSTGFSLLTLKENFNRSIYLLGKILREPHFGEKDFEREKKKMLDQILQLHDDAGYTASSVFEKLIFKNTYYEYPELGFLSTVREINNEDVKKFYSDAFSNSSCFIFITGNIERAELQKILNQQVGGWIQHKKIETPFIYPQRNPKTYYIIDKKDSAQCEIRIGHISKKRNSPDFYATRLMNTILGGQFSSRINLNLREAKGYTYGASSAFSYYQDAGLFEVHTAVNIENSAAAVKEILTELHRIKKVITKDEIEFAKSYLIKQFPSRFETYNQIVKNIESMVLHSLPLDELNKYEEKLLSVSNDEIINSAHDNVYPDESTIVLVGDKNKLKQQLKEEFDITPIELNVEGNRLG